MDLLDTAYDERSVRASSSEERHIVACLCDHLFPGHELANSTCPDASHERTCEEWDHVTFRCLKPRAGHVDLENAPPDACGARVLLRPALLSAAERPARCGATNRREQDDGETK